MSLADELRTTLHARLESTLSRIKEAAHRRGVDPATVRLLPVSKGQGVEKMLICAELLQQANIPVEFGENYVQECRQKREFLPPGTVLHLIGPLQSNKVREAVRLFHVIQSVHDEGIAALINKEAARIGKLQPIFIQVNISADGEKSGFSTEAAQAFIQQQLPNLTALRLDGIMTITRHYENPADARPDYRSLTNLSQRLKSDRPLTISMGMSQDFEVAIEEGATLVRIGSAMFGERG